MNLDNTDYTQSILCTYLTETKITFVIFNRFQKILFSSEEDINIEQELIEQLLLKPVLKKNYYKSIFIVSSNTPFTIIPEFIYNSNKDHEYLSLVSKTNKKDFIIRSNIPWLKSIILSTSNTNYYKIPVSFPHAKVVHEHHAIINSILYLNTLFKKAILLVKKADYIHILAYENTTLLFYNIFTITNNDDVAYYTLLIYNQCMFNQYEVPLVLAGNIELNYPELDILKEYIKKIELISLPIHTEPIMNTDQTHKYYSLFSSVLCEL